MSNDDDEYLITDANAYNTKLDDDTRVEDYEDFLDVARRVHLKLTSSVADAITKTSEELRRRRGIPDPREDRVGPRERTPADLLIDVARLQLDFLGKLADVTSAHGGEAHRFLEHLFARGGGGGRAKPSRMDVELYVVGGDEAKFEPEKRDIPFAVVNDWEADAEVSFTTGDFFDIESGAKHDPARNRLKVEPPELLAELGSPIRAVAKLDVKGAAFLPFHTYRVDINVLVGSRLRKSIELVVRSVPKPAIPTLEFRWDEGHLIPRARTISVVNDQAVEARIDDIRSAGYPLLNVVNHAHSNIGVKTRWREAGGSGDSSLLQPDDMRSLEVTLVPLSEPVSSGTYEREIQVFLSPKDAKPVLATRFRVSLEVP